jgi:hemerythrin-like domain-containing protein
MTEQQRFEGLLTDLDALANEMDDSDANQAEAASAIRVAADYVREAMSHLEIEDNLTYSSI